ncbi:hypothetical protein M8C21_033165, partial [Ambrosia artemisiifolia]
SAKPPSINTSSLLRSNRGYLFTNYFRNPILALETVFYSSLGGRCHGGVLMVEGIEGEMGNESFEHWYVVANHSIRICVQTNNAINDNIQPLMQVMRLLEPVC